MISYVAILRRKKRSSEMTNRLGVKFKLGAEMGRSMQRPYVRTTNSAIGTHTRLGIRGPGERSCSLVSGFPDALFVQNLEKNRLDVSG
jgi:hypothetical protein